MAETCEQKLERSEYRRRCQRIQLRRFQQLHAVSKHNALFTTMAVRKYEAERYRADALDAENADLRARAVPDGCTVIQGKSKHAWFVDDGVDALHVQTLTQLPASRSNGSLVVWEGATEAETWQDAYAKCVDVDEYVDRELAAIAAAEAARGEKPDADDD